MGKGTRKLSNNLRDLRQKNGSITQQELADLVGVTRQTVIAIEGNKYSPSLEVAFMIAQALGARIDDVFQYGAA
ncbi:helix-turn-helix transcriptional regulator [Cognatiluteimonas profundi]|uniref:helix-turn-helix transcriptional regulator n=1 Tax=Cognatiluteimonas profundi TaxID=2594501 RepID=UPI00131C2C82|nr:helix-turn-helix transcriptional regulator [Lysobacter profundi]